MCVCVRRFKEASVMLLLHTYYAGGKGAVMIVVAKRMTETAGECMCLRTDTHTGARRRCIGTRNCVRRVWCRTHNSLWPPTHKTYNSCILNARGFLKQNSIATDYTVILCFLRELGCQLNITLAYPYESVVPRAKPPSVKKKP